MQQLFWIGIESQKLDLNSESARESFLYLEEASKGKLLLTVCGWIKAQILEQVKSIEQ